MRWTSCAGVALMALTMSAPLCAQRATDAPVKFGPSLDSATTAQVNTIVQRAGAAGLPVEPIVAKVRLGALRHAPAATIVAAAAAVADRLRVARGLLGPLATPADLAAGADALSAGVTPDAVREIHAAAGTAAVAVPLGVLAELTASGVSAARAATIITTLIRRGAPAQQLVALGNDVNG
ncbi:MAG: hypothetical protein ACRENQ_15085, partial [Gemmatimonadaceae bacterium]